MNEKELTLKEIQNSLLEIMKVFDAFCRENDLQYFLSGGTLLGAVRHHGFIPWDDDVDVMMPRPDYDRLIAALRGRKLKERYELYGYESGNSSIPFSKLCDTRIIVRESITKTSDYLWIDIFPLDAVPENKKKSDRLLLKANSLRYKYSLSTAPLFTGKTFAKRLLKTPLVVYHKVINGGENCRYTKQILEMCKPDQYFFSKYVAGITWSCGPQERMLKESLYPVIKLPFCDALFPVSNNHIQYLKNMYDDYMTIPDEKDRKCHESTYYINE